MEIPPIRPTTTPPPSKQTATRSFQPPSPSLLAAGDVQKTRSVTIEQLQKHLEIILSYKTLGPLGDCDTGEEPNPISNITVVFSLTTTLDEFKTFLGVDAQDNLPENLNYFFTKILLERTIACFEKSELCGLSPGLPKATEDFIRTATEEAMNDDSSIKHKEEIKLFFWTKLCTWLNQVLANEENQTKGYWVLNQPHTGSR